MGETADVQRPIHVELSKDPLVRLWRNNNGAFKDSRGKLVRFGLGSGTSDLIGLKSTVITPEMVGQRVAVFVAIECKGPRTPTTEQQKTFVGVVQMLGGRAGIAKNLAEARSILR